TRRGLELLHTAFDLVQAAVGLLRGLVGRLGALGRALHTAVERIEARVDGGEFVAVGRAAGKAQGGDKTHANGTHGCQVELGLHFNPPSSGDSEYSRVRVDGISRLKSMLGYVDGA